MNFDKSKYPSVIITKEMITEAKRFIPTTEVNRTKASKIDTLTGHLGEFVFAEYFFGNYKKHNVGNNKGKTDFDRIEIKTSVFPFNPKLNLLVREDYAQKRKPDFYVQIIIDTDNPKADNIPPGTLGYLCGYADSNQVDNSPKKDFGSKISKKGGYKSHYINIKELRPMAFLLEIFKI